MDAIDIKVQERLALMITAAIIYHIYDGNISYLNAADQAIKLLDTVSKKLDERKGG